MTEYYKICGVPIRVNTARPTTCLAETELFRAEDIPGGICIRVEETYELHHERPPDGQAGEIQLWRIQNDVIRRTKDIFRTTPHIEAQYALTSPERVTVRIRKADWAWASGEKYFWSGIALNQLLLHFRTLLFHASYIEYQGRGILFTAPSGVGKSTQAELWRKHRGARIINGDKAGVSLRAAPMVHGVPFSGTSGISRNVSCPLSAVAVLSQAPENSARRMSPTQAVQALFGNVFIDSLVAEEWNLGVGLVLDLVEKVPVYALACTPDERAVEALEEVL